LQSSNEELQTAKEELQASNEELQALNLEMDSRNADLKQLSDDLLNLLTSLQTPSYLAGRHFQPSVARSMRNKVQVAKAAKAGHHIMRRTAMPSPARMWPECGSSTRKECC
jgi:chromosome segregation ATPase